MEAKSPESDTTTVLVALSWSRELGILLRVVIGIVLFVVVAVPVGRFGGEWIGEV